MSERVKTYIVSLRYNKEGLSLRFGFIVKKNMEWVLGLYIERRVLLNIPNEEA